MDSRDVVGAQLCVLQAEGVPGVVERDQRDAGDRRPGAVPRDEPVEEIGDGGEFRGAVQLIQDGPDVGVGHRGQIQARAGEEGLDDLDVPGEGLGHEERFDRGIADDPGLEVLRCPEGICCEDVALGEYLDDP